MSYFLLKVRFVLAGAAIAASAFFFMEAYRACAGP